jgi:hypothetical protein
MAKYHVNGDAFWDSEQQIFSIILVTEATKASPMNRVPPPKYPSFLPPYLEAMTVIPMVVTITT